MDKIKDFMHSDKSIGMDNLKLKFLSEKDESCYFQIMNPDDFLSKHKYEDNAEAYFLMFRSRDGGDVLIKVKSKYIGDPAFDRDNKDKIYDTALGLKDFRMQGKIRN